MSSDRLIGAPCTDKIRRPTRWLLRGGRPAARWLIRRRYDVVLHGAENVPRRGPVIFAPNHVGVIDGPLLAIFAPRPTHALTKIEMFNGLLGRCLRLVGQIPLDRYHYDPRAVKTTLRVLRAGGAVGVFPEGTRGSGELNRFHRGAAYFGLVTGAMVVPVTMLGTREPGGPSSSLPAKKAHIEMVFAPPFSVEPVGWPRTRATVGEISRLLRARMLADLDAALTTTGRSLPGPLPAGQREAEPRGGVTEQSA